jgi:subtilisin family serine protease
MKFNKLFVIIFLSCVWMSFTRLHAQLMVAPDRYRIECTDKNHSLYSVSEPQHFLSERALQRRERQGIKVTQADLPVSVVYIDSLKRMGFEVLNWSRWFNSATIRCAPEELAKLANIGFIKHTSVVQTEFIREEDYTTDTINNKEKDKFKLEYEVASAYYGKAAAQIGMMNGQALHERGFRGKGMFIGIIDGGFYKVNELSGFDSLRNSGRLRGFKNLTSDFENPLGNNTHGTNCFSIIAACLPEQMIGSAPDADYLLVRSEETDHELLVEEDNWIAAVEYADSMGVDLITSSLGYTTLDDSLQNHRHSELDGRTVRTSKAATMAAARGIIVCNSAGNSGDKRWTKISVPADADSIVTIGAVFPNGRRVSFSSIGPSADGRIKPDLMATGGYTFYQNSQGNVAFGFGTSYSTPLLAGLIACFWQANPDKGNIEIIEMVKRSASHYNSPGPFYGYGIPDFSKAMEQQKQ